MGWFACEVAVVFVVALFKLSDEGDLIIGIVGLQLIGDVALFAFDSCQLLGYNNWYEQSINPEGY